MIDERSKDDIVVEVKLPYKDYLVLRDIIEERQAMSGLKKWLMSRVFWLTGGLLTILGLIEAFRRLGS